MIESLRSVWLNRDLRNKVFYVLAMFVFIRFLSHVPLPEIDRSQLLNFLNRSENQVFNVLSLFTGGSLTQLSIDMLGVGPYITASIVIQILTKAIPAWDALNKEGSSGREKLNQYSRYLALPLAFVQGYGTLALLKSQQVLPALSSADTLKILLTISATSLFVMWLGELISEKGIGNGISLIIALGIIARLPTQLGNTLNVADSATITSLIVFGLVSIITIAVIVLVNEAERKVPITYARRQAGSSRNSVDSFLPIKINIAGVIPIIFALSFLTFPAVIARFLSTARSEALVNMGEKITAFVGNNLYYGLSYFILVLVFTFFYTYIVFEPKQIAENLQKQGSFIPGIRPGRETINFLYYVITRLTVMGALFLALIAVLPIIVEHFSTVKTLVVGGTGILIVVAVVIETGRQIASQISMRRYDMIS